MWTYMEKATRLWLCVRMTTITTWNNISKKNCLPSWWRFPGQLLNLKQLKNWKISNLFVKELTKSWLNGYVRLKEQRIALGAQFRLSATACTFTHTHARGMFGNHQITPTLGKFLFSSEFFFFWTQVSLAITTATNSLHTGKKKSLDEQQMANSKIKTVTLVLVGNNWKTKAESNSATCAT